VRELSREPIDLETLRFGSEQEKEANEFVVQGKVKLTKSIENDVLYLKGKMKEDDVYINTLAVIDKDQRLVDGSCQCDFYESNKLKHGPCAHILATRMQLHAGVV